ncbi:plastocyanin/azurin family copper-binding protein [Halorussus amylolyticus]|uniref:plastocyanin/azurin family copper-binding protein n=1 Tax=Halorussus amylolyticus TaxID=1126242 RepID=UPI00104DC60E|nr:plastocyanin/azurin family copper-binding protein [Halorussus amylolyticus]
MNRRTFLGRAAEVGGIGGLVGLAGCAAPIAPQATEETAGDEPTDQDEATPEETTGEATATEGTTTDEDGGADGGETQSVAMITEGSEYYFDPIGLFVEPGTTVSFVNESGAHSATAYAEGTGGAEETRIPEDAEPWNSETLTEEGATFEHTFEVGGTYDYFCIPHKTLGMVGRIVVGEPGGPAEGSMPPDGDVPESQRIVEEGAVSYEAFSE